MTGCLSGLSSFIIILTDEWDFMSHMALVSCELMSLHTCENLLLFLFISLFKFECLVNAVLQYERLKNSCCNSWCVCSYIFFIVVHIILHFLYQMCNNTMVSPSQMSHPFTLSGWTVHLCQWSLLPNMLKGGSVKIGYANDALIAVCSDCLNKCQKI